MIGELADGRELPAGLELIGLDKMLYPGVRGIPAAGIRVDFQRFFNIENGAHFLHLLYLKSVNTVWTASVT